MPILKNAKKKLRQDKKRTGRNHKLKETYRELIKAAKTQKTPESISKAFSSIDKAAKQNIIHKNKAAHIKSSISKTASAPVKKTTPAPIKKISTSPKPAKPAKPAKVKKSA